MSSECTSEEAIVFKRLAVLYFAVVPLAAFVVALLWAWLAHWPTVEGVATPTFPSAMWVGICWGFFVGFLGTIEIRDNTDVYMSLKRSLGRWIGLIIGGVLLLALVVGPIMALAFASAAGARLILLCAE